MKIAVMVGVVWILAACASPTQSVDFDRPMLLESVSQDIQSEIVFADRHILIVRHARKISPDCNALNCQLSPRGEAMVSRLSDVLGREPFDAAYASAACRTTLTAEAGGSEVIVHQAAEGYETGCVEGEIISRQRREAFLDAHQADARWTLVGEHSNTSCLWLAEFAGLEASQQAGCVDGRLDHDAYGHIYWLYRHQGTWNLIRLESVFEVADET